MEDSLRISSSTNKLEVSTSASSKRSPRRALVAFIPKTFKHMPLVKHCSGEYAGHIAIFLLKVAGLELIRRFSKTKFPFAWRGLQALQILCYPPFKWVARWAPFKGLVMGMQNLSKPLFFLSIATAFSDESVYHEEIIDDTNDSQESQPYPELSSRPSTENTSSMVSIRDQASQSQETESWLLQLHNELEKQGIVLPERIGEDELRRYYTAANGDFSYLVASVKKTVRWRQTYHLLSVDDLEMWSHLVFWHGYDIKLRPCLIIRLGLACSSLTSPDRPRFAQAIVSQLEHGVMNLVISEDPQVTVVMDCEGLSPFKFPMQMLRSCSTLMQDHYPNRLACLLIIRLPPVVRVLAQTFFQVLKPATRKKLRIEGERYKHVLSEYLQNIPSYLGGECTCPRCSPSCNFNTPSRPPEDSNVTDPSGDCTSDEPPSLAGDPHFTDLDLNSNCEHVLRTAMIAMLMLWILIGLLAGMYDPQDLL